jgi:hypothetical protein
MLQNLVIGSALAALTVLIHTAGLIAIAAVTPRLAHRLKLQNHAVGRTLVMTGAVMGLLATLTLEVWSWAVVYALIGITGNFEDALALSTSLFSTIGTDKIAFDPAWRLLTALEGVNGFLMIGWSTAYLVRASTLHGPFRPDHF